MGRKTKEQVNADAVIALREDLDLANAEIKRLKRTIALTSHQLKLLALCLETKNE